MKSFSVICGLPRSGSTLLCNLLSQHEEIYCSSTSPLVAGVASYINTMSSAEETKSLLIADREQAETAMTKSVKGLVQGWYSFYRGHVFDKGRGWSYNFRTLKHITDKPFGIVLVRDPRDVVASIHANKDKYPLFDGSPDPISKTRLAQTENLMEPNGLVGSCITAVEDLIRRSEGDAMFLKYENFVKNPVESVERIAEKIGLDKGFAWDVDNIENQSTDVDGVYLNKFPHEGDGKITEEKVGTWGEILDPDLADAVRARYPFFCKNFGY